MQLKKLSAEQFAIAARASRMEAKSVEVARQILVLGRRQSEVADELELTRQWVNEIVKKMRRYVAQADVIPSGWVLDTAILPIADWKKVRQLERQARAKFKSSSKRKTTR